MPALRRSRHAVMRSCASRSKTLEQIPESLEDCAVAEPVGVLDETLVVAVLALDVLTKNIRHRSDASTKARIVEDVDNRP